jgi:hypothetical protein
MSIFCAWVLWGTPYDKTTGTQAGTITAMNGFEKRDDCMKELRSLADGTNEKQINIKFNWDHACLPDTVDPRAPKASR